jgi:hypothetical protein
MPSSDLFGCSDLEFFLDLLLKKLKIPITIRLSVQKFAHRFRQNAADFYGLSLKSTDSINYSFIYSVEDLAVLIKCDNSKNACHLQGTLAK